MVKQTENRAAPADDTSDSSVGSGIHRSAYVNWFLIATVILLTAVSSLSVLPPVLSDRFSSVWIFSKQEMTVIVGLSLTLILLAGLAHQQRYLRALRTHFAAEQQLALESAERQTARLYALLNVSRVMVAQSDLQSVFDSITRLCCDAFGCDQASLMLYDADTNTLEVRAVSGKQVREGVLGARQPYGKGISGWVAQRREPLLLKHGDRPSDIPGLDPTKKELSAAMVVPVILRDELVGVINVSARMKNVEFDADDLRALQAFAENVGAAVRHTEQADWMRTTIRKLQSQKDRSGITGVFSARPVPGNGPPDPEA